MQSNLFVTNLFKGVTKRILGFLDNKGNKAGLTWLKIKYLKHARPGKIRFHSYKGKQIFYSSPQELLHTLKEIYIEEIYKIELPDEPYVIDCGANIGLAVLYLKEQYPNAEVVAFEPDEQNFQLLQRNITSFNLTRVTAKKEAVWTANTMLDFTNEGTMGSKIQLEATSKTRKVQAFRLKDLLNRKVDFLKIDIEGAEYEVLKDIKENLKNINNLFLEYHGNFNQNKDLTEMFNIIQAAGFYYYIKEAADIYGSPFVAASSNKKMAFDIQLNLFCFKKL